MRHLTAVSSDELIDSLHAQVIMSTICSAMRLMISWRVKIFLSLFITFRTNIRMNIIYLSPCSFLFALHLDWSLNTSVDKKIECSFYICEIVFHFGFIFSWNAQKKREKANRKKLNVDRQFFKDVLCVTLLQ